MAVSADFIPLQMWLDRLYERSPGCRGRRRLGTRLNSSRGSRARGVLPATCSVSSSSSLKVRALRNRRDMRPDSERAQGRRGTAETMMPGQWLEVQDEEAARFISG